MNIRQQTQVVAFVEHAATLKNMRKEMVATWDSLKTEDKKCPIVEDHATRVKAQCVQLYTRALMKLVAIHDGFDLFPMAQEEVSFGNWRVDSLVNQIWSNEIKDHDHMFQLLMTNIYGVPTSMFDYIKEEKVEVITGYMNKTYSLAVITDEDVKAVLDKELAGEGVV